jgi:hypothetical protein
MAEIEFQKVGKANGFTEFSFFVESTWTPPPTPPPMSLYKSLGKSGNSDKAHHLKKVMKQIHVQILNKVTINVLF